MLAVVINQEVRAGQAILVGDTTVIPLAKVLIIRLPFLASGLIWNRPASVVVRAQDREEQIVPVRDVTRQALLALAAGSVVMAGFAWLARSWTKVKWINKRG